MSRLLRVAWGAVLLARPEAVLAAAGAAADPRTVALGRVLGVRHLAQAAAVGPGAPLLLRRLGAAGDVLHVGSLVLAIVVLPGYRRAAVADGTVESVVTALSLRDARR